MYMGMVVLMLCQIWCMYGVAHAYRQVDASDKQAMKKMGSKLVNQITDIVKLILCNLDRLTRKKINT